MINIIFLPSDNQEAGLAARETIKGHNVRSVEVGAAGQNDGTITITYSNDPAIDSRTIIFSPSTYAGSIKWVCTAGTVAFNYRPSNCR